jgi:hypothetical protein
MSVEQSITASAGVVEEHAIALPDSMAIRTLGGTAIISQGGIPKAEVGWLAFRRAYDTPGFKREPANFFIVNGGPSTAGTGNNGLLWGSPMIMPHRPDGHLDADALPEFREELLVWPHASTVIYYDPPGTGISKLLTDDPYWHYGVQRDADIFAAFGKFFRYLYTSITQEENN